MITEVAGITVGHWTDPVGMTGCTVVLCPPGTMGSGQVRGGSPGTRETDLLRPGTFVQEVHAVLLTGGSAFGLAAADGVVRYLEERDVGLDAGVARVPIVPAAVLFDLALGDPLARPGSEQGYQACLAAGVEVAEGNVGAGTGATVAKLHGPAGAVKGGMGSASRREGGLVVGALAAVNSLGEIVDGVGGVLAGSRLEADEQGQAPPGSWPRPGTNTTLAVVATNARLSKDRAHLLALAAHEGFDRAIRPAHTMWDGDTAFTLATGQLEADQRLLERMAAEAVAEAIRRGVLCARSVPGAPAASRETC